MTTPGVDTKRFPRMTEASLISTGSGDRRPLQSIGSTRRRAVKKAPRRRGTLQRGSKALGTVGRSLKDFKSLLCPLQIQSLAVSHSLSFFIFPVYLSCFAFILSLIWRVRRQMGKLPKIGRKFNTGKGEAEKSRGERIWGKEKTGKKCPPGWVNHCLSSAERVCFC